jgi:hypothetical protein
MMPVFVRQSIILKEDLNFRSHFGRDVFAGKGKSDANDTKRE